MHIKTILVPIDFSQHSLHALQIASRLAAERGASLDLLHVWQPREEFTVQSPPAIVLAAQEQAARTRLEQLQAAGYSGNSRLHLSIGAVADEIIRCAEACNSDLIVMGTYGCSGMRPYAVGSVAEAVVRRAACPVLTCKLITALRPMTPRAFAC
jgi:nucleotide-binding universal stress UspA family protein